MDVQRIHRSTLYTGKIFDLFVDDVVYASGNKGIREVVHHPGGAVVVPLFDDGRVMMVKQYRYPFGKYLLELPAGKLNKGEAPDIAANREFEEETGWQATRLTKLTSIYTTPGFCDEELHLYLATGLHEAPDGHKREEAELSMSVHIMPLAEALGLALDGTIKDSKTVVGLLLADRHSRDQR